MLEWSALFATQIDIVDQQHKRLFEMLNHIAMALSSGKQNVQGLDQAFDELMEYSRQHFIDEEKVMTTFHVDKRHVTLQRMEHQSFIYDVERMRSETSIDVPMTERFERIIKFIASWLVYHTLRTDQVMGLQVAAIQNGKTPEVAYESALATTLNPAITQKVLDAALHLWAEAVERNQVLEQRIAVLQGKS